MDFPGKGKQKRLCGWSGACRNWRRKDQVGLKRENMRRDSWNRGHLMGSTKPREMEVS